MKSLSTKVLIYLIGRYRGTVFEVNLNDEIFRATHFLKFGGRKIYDIGIDSQETIWGIEEFKQHYPLAFCNISQIV